MNDMIEGESRDLSGEVSRANIVHGEIMASKKQVAVGIYELARGLKTMRDEKLYLRLDCEDFESYCEKLAKVNVSQAYKYIKTYEELGGGILQSSGNLGIEKLFLITQLPYDEKNRALDDPSEIEGMSVRELKQFVEQARNWGDQIRFLESELQAQDRELREKETKIGELTEESDSYRRDTDDMIAKLKAEYERGIANEQSASKRKLEIAESNAQLKLSEERERLRVQLENKYKQKIEDAKAIGEKLGRESVAAATDEQIKAAKAEGEKAGRDEGAAEYEKLKADYQMISEMLAAGQSENEDLKQRVEKLKKNESGTKSACKVYLESLINTYENAEDFVRSLEKDDAIECANALQKLTLKINTYAVELLEKAKMR